MHARNSFNRTTVMTLNKICRYRGIREPVRTSGHDIVIAFIIIFINVIIILAITITMTLVSSSASSSLSSSEDLYRHHPLTPPWRHQIGCLPLHRPPCFYTYLVESHFLTAATSNESHHHYCAKVSNFNPFLHQMTFICWLSCHLYFPFPCSNYCLFVWPPSCPQCKREGSLKWFTNVIAPVKSPPQGTPQL